MLDRFMQIQSYGNRSNYTRYTSQPSLSRHISHIYAIYHQEIAETFIELCNTYRKRLIDNFQTSIGGNVLIPLH